MSQEKVERYKEEKRKRKANLAKKKRKALITKICGSVVVAVLAVWIGYSAVDSYQKSVNSAPVTVDLTALDEYTSSLTEE